MLAIIMAVLLLGACGDKKESGQTGKEQYDNPRNHTAEDFMPIGKGFEEYPVWIETAEEPVRDSKIKNVYVFENGKVTMYNLDNSDSKVVIEDILEMSDKELTKLARETSNKIYNDYEKEIKDKKLFDVESFNDVMMDFQLSVRDDFEDIYESYLDIQKPLTEDIYYTIEGERPKQSSSKYTLDIKIDDLGQHTEKMKLTIPKASSKLVNVGNGFSEYIEFLYINADTVHMKMFEEEFFNEINEEYVEQLKKSGTFEARDGFELTHPQNFVPKPYTWEKEDKELSLKGPSFNQKIFDTTFSGIKAGSGSLITRVDDSFVGFRLDSPDTKNKNVTIEGK